mmetsp:Transcript_22698/g.47103  ORF Transcript_22698/g.47103 Transcript_22698/m.47103 type:complete len:352 (-) Transcript_22698:1446-2501(-)
MARRLLLCCFAAVTHVVPGTDGLASQSRLPEELRRALRSSPPTASASNAAAETTAASQLAPSSTSKVSIYNLLSPTDRSRFADSPDESFYASAMIVQHNDDAFRSKLSSLYSEVLPPGGGGTFLDLGSSWTSHLPDEPQPTNVWLHGMNAEELDRNPAGNGWKIVRSFNDPDDPINKLLSEAAASSTSSASSTRDGDKSITTSAMLLPEIPDSSVDVVGVCAAFQYWRFPERVVGEILRVLKPGGTCVVSFSNRCFASKAVGAWSRRAADRERMQYVSDVLTHGARILEHKDGGGADSPNGTNTYGLKVERRISDGSAAAALAMPLSMMMGYQMFGDPFLAIVANKQPSSR